MVKASQREDFMARLQAAHPNPESELHWTTPYELLVAVVLSAQATDKGVNLATDKLFPVANTPEAIVSLGVDGLIPYVRTIGLYKNKAKNVVALSQILIDKFGSEVPEDFDALTSLPGVGRKTANVVLNVAFKHPTIPVDTHVFRVANRTKFAPGKTPDEVEDLLVKRVPAKFALNAHHYLLLHGRYCCKARNPECERCPVADYCSSPDKKTRLKAVAELTPGA